MGNTQSNQHLYGKLEQIIPTSETKQWGMFDKSCKPFAGHKDREQFLWAAITVLTQNGRLLLGDHQIRLLYSRRDNDRVVARLVAEKEGIIKTKVEPGEDGRDQAEAFYALRRDIEIKLDRILCDVPGEAASSTKVQDASSSPGGSVALSGGCGRAPARRPLAPPPQPTHQAEREHDADRIMIHNEGPPAYGDVNAWSTMDDKKR